MTGSRHHNMCLSNLNNRLIFCHGFLPITAGRDSSGGLPGVEFIIGATGSDAQKRRQGIFVSDYGDNYSYNVGSHRKFCTMGRRACETAIHTLTARADGINATVRNNYCLVTEHAPLDVVKLVMISIRDLQERDGSTNIGCRS